MTRSDSPEFRFGGLRCDAVEELPRFHLPAPQVLTQDPRLQIVRKLLDPNRLTMTPEAQLTPAESTKVLHPLQRIHGRSSNLARLPTAYNQDAGPPHTDASVRQPG